MQSLLAEFYGVITVKLYSRSDTNEKLQIRHKIRSYSEKNQVSSMSYPDIMYSRTGPDSSVGRVSAPGNGRSRVQSSLGTQTYEVELGLVDSVCRYM